MAYSWSCPEGSTEVIGGNGCDCGTGFWYDGLSCVDINECQLYKPCQEGECIYLGADRIGKNWSLIGFNINESRDLNNEL